jgi:hypothetical protein
MKNVEINSINLRRKGKVPFRLSKKDAILTGFTEHYS